MTRHDSNPHYRPRQAVVLVGGRGTRLGALAADAPKPMMGITADRVFLDFLLDNIARHGVEEIVLLAGHLSKLVFARYDGRRVRGARVSVVTEAEPAGTAGALLGVADRLDPAFFLLNGDGFLDCNLLALSSATLPPGGGVLMLRKVEDAARYGRVRVAGSVITAFEEKQPSTEPGLINGGVYWLDRGVVDLIDRTPCSLESDIFPLLVNRGLLSGVETSGYFIDIGLPHTLAQARRQMPDVERRPAAFFDRDGTLNIDDGYTHDPDSLRWIPGAVEAIRRCNESGYYVVVCTNQAGVARGLYDESAVDAFHDRMRQELAGHGAHIDAFYHAPYHTNAAVERYRHEDHPDRKPNPGMIRRAMSEWPIRPEGSFMVGDRSHDVAAAEAAGIRGVLFDTDNLMSMLDAAGVPLAPEKIQ